MRTSGQPFVGYISLTNVAPGPVNVPILVLSKGGATVYTLATKERLYITSISISGNDTANPICQIDDGAGTPRVMARVYSSTTVPAVITPVAGTLFGSFGVPLRAGCAGGITSAKTVEVVINGYVAQV